MKPLPLRLVFRLLSVCILAMASACSPSQTSAPTGYETADPKWGKRFGYRERQLSANEFGVIVKGNQNTPAQQVADIALLRAAYISRENGARFFVVRDAEVSVLSSDETVSAPVFGAFSWFPVGRRPTEEPQAVLLFEIVRGKGGKRRNYVSADTVIKNLS